MSKYARLCEECDKAGLIVELSQPTEQLWLIVRNPKIKNKIVARAQFDPSKPDAAAGRVAAALLNPDI